MLPNYAFIIAGSHPLGHILTIDGAQVLLTEEGTDEESQRSLLRRVGTEGADETQPTFSSLGDKISRSKRLVTLRLDNTGYVTRRLLLDILSPSELKVVDISRSDMSNPQQPTQQNRSRPPLGMVQRRRD